MGFLSPLHCVVRLERMHPQIGTRCVGSAADRKVSASKLASVRAGLQSNPMRLHSNWQLLGMGIMLLAIHAACCGEAV